MVGVIISSHSITLSAQNVNISGKVTDRNSNGVEGATVSLPGRSMTTATGADGSYTLESGARINGQGGYMAQYAGLGFTNGILTFKVQKEKEQVHIGMYTLTGKCVVSLVDRELAKGEYRINTFLKNLSSQIYFLRIMIGTSVTMLTMPVVESKLLQNILSSAPQVHIEKESKKRSGVVDSIIVQKSGYSRGHRNIESYVGTHNFIIVDTAWFWSDRSMIPNANNVMTYVFLNRTNGAFSDDEVFWQEPGTNTWHSIAEQKYYDMSVGSSGRLTFSVGEKGGQYWDFEEHTISSTAWYGNTTRVDGWRLPFALRLHCSDGFDEILGEEYHIFYMDRDSIFQMFKDAVPDEFHHCADNGYPFRIIAPGKGDGGFAPGQQHANYMLPYLQELGINGPTTEQVFACAGSPFGSNAQLAGAVNRHVAHLDQSQWGNGTLFYLEAPANFYAKFWHDHSFQGKAYGFAYDDAEGFASYTAHDNPEYLIMAIGGY